MPPSRIQQKTPLGEPIKIAQLPTCPETAILAMKLLMAPSAYGAKWLTSAADAVECIAKGRPREECIKELGSMVGLPYAYTADWLQTATSFWGKVFLGGRR